MKAVADAGIYVYVPSGGSGGLSTAQSRMSLAFYRDFTQCGNSMRCEGILQHRHRQWLFVHLMEITTISNGHIFGCVWSQNAGNTRTYFSLFFVSQYGEHGASIQSAYCYMPANVCAFVCSPECVCVCVWSEPMLSPISLKWLKSPHTHAPILQQP